VVDSGGQGSQFAGGLDICARPGKLAKKSPPKYIELALHRTPGPLHNRHGAPEQQDGPTQAINPPSFFRDAPDSDRVKLRKRDKLEVKPTV
jgi:hypothetical protein